MISSRSVSLVLALTLFICREGICQTANNYGYDHLGRLTHDYSLGVTEIGWNRHNHMTSIKGDGSTNGYDLDFGYDVFGNKILQILKPKNESGVLPEYTWIYTYYQYNAQGSLYAIYERAFEQISMDRFAENLILKEHYLSYGGVRGYESQGEPTLISRNFTAEIGLGGRFENVVYDGAVNPSSNSLQGEENFAGHSRYQLMNHLGDVNVLVSNRKQTSLSSVHAEVLSASGYYPFGMLLPDQSTNANVSSFGMNGQEKVQTLSSDGNLYTAKYWMYDSRIGRRWNLDPKPSPELSRYATFANNPVLYADPLGDTVKGEIGYYEFQKEKVRHALGKLENKRVPLLDVILAGKALNQSDRSKLKALNTSINELQHSLHEMDVLENSDDVYNIILNPSVAGAGKTAIRSFKGEVDVMINSTISMDEQTEAFVHELTHAYQYETGEVSFQVGGYTGSAYDLTDEANAFKRGLALTGLAGAVDPMIMVVGRYFASSMAKNLSGSAGILPISRGDFLKLHAYRYGVKQTQERLQLFEYFKGWKSYYNMGVTGQPSQEIQNIEKKLIDFLERMNQSRK